MMVDWDFDDSMMEYYMYVYYFEAIRVWTIMGGIWWIPKYEKCLQDMKIMKA